MFVEYRGTPLMDWPYYTPGIVYVAAIGDFLFEVQAFLSLKLKSRDIALEVKQIRFPG